MSDTHISTGKDFLNHFGILGMKWGVRNDSKSLSKADKTWEKKAIKTGLSHEQYAHAVNEAISNFNRDIGSINNQPRFKNANLVNDSPIRQEYHDAVENMMQRHLDRSARANLPTNPSGTRQFRIVASTLDTGGVRLVGIDDVKKFEHADDSSGQFIITLTPVKDDSGHILSYKVLKELSQDVLGKDFLEHYGVLGMKWGVRKDKEDISELDDDTLRRTVERMRLEKQYREIKGGRSAGQGLQHINRNATAIFGVATAAAGLVAVAGKVRKYMRGLQALGA